MTPFIVYGIKDPRADVFVYVGKSTIGLMRPYGYFYQPERCHSPALKSWIIGLGQERHAPEQFVHIIGRAANKEQLHRLEADLIHEYSMRYALLNKTWKADTNSPPLTILCDAELAARAARKLAERRMTLDEFVTLTFIDLLRDEEINVESPEEPHPKKGAIAHGISKLLDWESSMETWTWKTAKEALVELGVIRPNHTDKTIASRVIFNLNGGQKRKSNGYIMLLCPAPKHTTNK